MNILAIDPGPAESGVVQWYHGILEALIIDNETLRFRLLERTFGTPDICAIEMVACYGMPVGKEVFETCLWIGRFIECSEVQPKLIYRRDVKLHLCGSARAKDGNIRQALIDKHGPCGTKKAPGKLYGVSGHLWAALAVADYAGAHFKPGNISLTPTLI